MHLFLANARKYGEHITSQDCWKALALLLMTADHIGFLLHPPHELWWRVAGRLCVPIWFFFVGYARPNSQKKELYWLAAMLIVAKLALLNPLFPLNILVTIILTRLVLETLKPERHDVFSFMMIAVIAVALYLPSFILIEYGTIGLLFALAGYYQRHIKGWLPVIAMGIATLSYLFTQGIALEFSQMQLQMLVIFSIFINGLLLFFKPIQFKLNHCQICSFIVRFLGRNTQYYYVFHFIILMMIALVLYPPTHWEIKWLG